MPLKHAIETFLLVILGVVLGVTGVVAYVLPPLPEGAIFWGILWIVTLLYPLILYPYLRYRRADYTFRLLHFLPAALAMFWLLFALVAFYIPAWEAVLGWYVWGFSVIPVLLCVLCVCLFSLRVIRQRVVRVATVSLLFGMFAVSAVAWEFSAPSPSQVAMTEENTLHLEHSDDPHEESWRKRLRRMERREERLQEQDIVRDIPVQSASSASSFSSKPPILPSSGPALGMGMLLLFASYPALLHERARRRV